MTPDLLRQATGCTREAADLFAPLLAEAMQAYAINTPERQAAFLAQVGHESGSLRYMAELWGPTAAQLTYEGRANLDNTEPGDGLKFKGRGLIQTTGRFNYCATRDRLREKFGLQVPDFEAYPQALEQPRWAAMSAADYWGAHNCNAYADVGDFDGLTKVINGGLNGIEDRRARLKRAQEALGAPAAPTPAPAPQKPATATPAQPPKGFTMPPFLLAALPILIQAIPKLAELFGSGTAVSDRNIKAVQTVAEIVQTATAAPNIQAAVESIQADPVKAAAAVQAVQDNWFALTEAGGGGIDGARKADAATTAAPGMPWYAVIRSPSFLMGILLLPLVYLIVLSMIGVVGAAEWSPGTKDNTAGLLIGTIVGGLVGYYYGMMTSGNKATAQQ